MASTATCRTCGRGFERSGRYGSGVYCKRCTAKADREFAKRLRVDCKECGKKFSAPKHSVRYCSDACRSATTRRRNRDNQRKYLSDPKNRAIKLARTRRAAAASRARDQGEKPPPPRPGREVESQRPNAKPAEPYACALCGRDFAPYGSGARPVHCRRCAAMADEEMDRAMAVSCKECGKEFSTRNRIVRYCSPKCRAASHNRSRAESIRRRMADPEGRAMVAARWRAWAAARRGEKKGRGGS